MLIQKDSHTFPKQNLNFLLFESVIIMMLNEYISIFFVQIS